MAPESRLMKFSIPNLRIPSHTDIFKEPQSVSCYMDKWQPSRSGCSYHKHSSLIAAPAIERYMLERTAAVSIELHVGL